VKHQLAQFIIMAKEEGGSTQANEPYSEPGDHESVAEVVDIIRGAEGVFSESRQKDFRQLLKLVDDLYLKPTIEESVDRLASCA
jgi:hypothetical protein